MLWVAVQEWWRCLESTIRIGQPLIMIFVQMPRGTNTFVIWCFVRRIESRWLDGYKESQFPLQWGKRSGKKSMANSSLRRSEGGLLLSEWICYSCHQWLYARHLALKGDPYLESREKEDAFVKGIIEAVEQKVLDNLPGLAGMYMMQQQSLLSVLGLQGMVPVQQQVPMPQMVQEWRCQGRYQHPYKSRIKGKRLWLAEMDVEKEITLRRMRKRQDRTWY